MISDQSPQYFLIFHAIDLALKAFLINKRKTNGELRKAFRHDLLGLYEEAKRSGLNVMSNDADKDIFWINEWHGGAGIRYDFGEQRTLPICSTLFPLADEIIEACR